MRAIIVDPEAGPQKLREQEVADPVPGSNQVLIRVVSAGVNMADLGAVSSAAAEGRAFTPGIEVAGLEVGTDRPVMALTSGGGYAELAVADRRLVFDAAGIDLTRAGGALIANLTAYLSLRHAARLAQGEEVLVPAAGGGLGSAAIQAARALGAGRVIGLASTQEKRDIALAQGADAVAGYEDELPKVDVIVDTLGGSFVDRALTLLKPLGRLISIGNASGEPPPPLDVQALRAQVATVAGFSFGTLRRWSPEWVREAAAPAIELMRAGRLAPAWGHAYPLAEAAEAHRVLAGRLSLGKMVLLP